MKKTKSNASRSLTHPLLRYVVALMAVVSSIVVNHVSCHRSDAQIATETQIHTCFAPDGDCMGLIVSNIDAARVRILVQAYVFTSQEIANALIRAHQRKVEVQMLIDKGAVTFRGSKINLLLQAGIPIRIDKTVGLAHNKIMIIDDECVLTGSFNWTDSAQTRNAENLVMIRGKTHCSVFKENWYKRASVGEQLPRTCTTA